MNISKKYPRECPNCGEIVFHSSIGSRSHCKNDKCRKCSDKNKSRVRTGEHNGKWEGYKGVSLTYFNDVKNNAKKRGIFFDITIQQMWDQFERQGKKCVYTGIELQLPSRNRERRNGNASLDRIDSFKGYTLNNIQWVHKDINWMKQDFEQIYFIEMCRLVSNTHENIITPIDIFIKNARQLTTF